MTQAERSRSELDPPWRVAAFMTPNVISSVLLVLGCLWMMPHGDFMDAAVFRHFWIGYGLMGLGFAMSWGVRRLNGLHFWAIAILCRLILLWMHPGDDIWRYLWEGLIQNQGFSPYHVAPTAPELAAFRTEWWVLINHPDVSAIYPPLTQWGFRLLAAISPSVLLFKLAFVAADLGICHLLAQRYGYARTLLYAWNPIVLYSFAAGGHYDSWFLLALVAAWLSFDTADTSATTDTIADTSDVAEQAVDRPSSRSHDAGRSLQAYGWSAFWIGISIAFKWISLPILVFMAWRGVRHGRWVVIPIVAVLGSLPMVLTSLAFCDSTACPLVPTSSVFVSYGRSAELIPHLVGQVWDASRWSNRVFALPLALWVGWLILRSRSFLQFSEWYLFGVFIMSPIAHSWYFTWIVPFAVSSRNWGTRFLSISAMAYFALPYRQSTGDVSWNLRDLERVLLWAPFLIGWGTQMLLNRGGAKGQTVMLSTNSYDSPRSDS